MMKAAEGGQMEVHLAQIAQRQGASDKVKEYAQRLEQDHTQANKDLMGIAQNRGVSLPTSMAGEHQTEMDKLSKLQGADFDKAYIKMMVKDHKKDIKEFEKASNNSMDTDLKTFATNTLPKLREHLTMAQSLERDTSGKSTSTMNNSSDTSGTRSRTSDTDNTSGQSKRNKSSKSDNDTTNTVTRPPSSQQTTTPPPQH